MRLHARAYDRDLADLAIGIDARDRELSLDGLERARGGAQVVPCDRERDLCVATLTERLILNDRVDVAAGVGERAEDRRGGAGPVGHAEQRDPGLVRRMRDGRDEGMLHCLVFSEYNGTRPVLEARATMDPDTVVAGVLDRAQLQHLG